MQSMLGILIWIQLQGIWEIIECTLSASMRQCIQLFQQEYRVNNYEAKVSEMCYGACRMCIAC